jgi:hypothetical protein
MPGPPDKRNFGHFPNGVQKRERRTLNSRGKSKKADFSNV